MKHKKFALGVMNSDLLVGRARLSSFNRPVFQDGYRAYVGKSFGGEYFMYRPLEL